MNVTHSSARKLGLVSCQACHLLSRKPKTAAHETALCSRCGEELQQRKPNSLVRTWALLIAAMVFYIPANVLPMTITSALGSVSADTIMSGVIYFMQHGSWEIALVIFTASVFVPFLKFTILIYLLLSVQFKSIKRPKDRTRLYRFTEAIGRWSMLDIYVISIFVAIMNRGVLASATAEIGAVIFASVVIITIIAARSFDPRLIWSNEDDQPSGG